MGAVSLALFVQAWELTRSPSALGLLGLIQFAALAAGTLGGSAIVDHIDRRLLLLFTQAGFGITVLMLWVGSLVGDPPIFSCSRPRPSDHAWRACTSRPAPP